MLKERARYDEKLKFYIINQHIYHPLTPHYITPKITSFLYSRISPITM